MHHLRPVRFGLSRLLQRSFVLGCFCLSFSCNPTQSIEDVPPQNSPEPIATQQILTVQLDEETLPKETVQPLNGTIVTSFAPAESYRLEEDLFFDVEITNSGDESWSGAIFIEVIGASFSSHLAAYPSEFKQVWTAKEEVTLNPNESQKKQFTVPADIVLDFGHGQYTAHAAAGEVQNSDMISVEGLLELDIEGSTEVAQGEEAFIHLHITNPSDHPVNQIKIFSDGAPIEEKVIASLGANESTTVSWQFVVTRRYGFTMVAQTEEYGESYAFWKIKVAE